MGCDLSPLSTGMSAGLGMSHELKAGVGDKLDVIALVRITFIYCCYYMIRGIC